MQHLERGCGSRDRQKGGNEDEIKRGKKRGRQKGSEIKHEEIRRTAE